MEIFWNIKERFGPDWSKEEIRLWGDVSETVDNLVEHCQLAFGTPGPQWSPLKIFKHHCCTASVAVFSGYISADLCTAFIFFCPSLINGLQTMLLYPTWGQTSAMLMLALVFLFGAFMFLWWFLFMLLWWFQLLVLLPAISQVTILTRKTQFLPQNNPIAEVLSMETNSQMRLLPKPVEP